MTSVRDHADAVVAKRTGQVAASIARIGP